MKETIMNIIVYAAPLVAGFITSTVIPLIIKKFTLRRLEKRIDEINEGKALRDIKMDLQEIKNEINILRGKSK